MINNSNKALVKYRFLLTILLTTLIIFSGCEPVFDLEIENKTSQTLTIIYVEVKIGDLDPDETILLEDISTAGGPILITAINDSGETVFKENITSNEWGNIDENKIYKVIITNDNTKILKSDNGPIDID